MMCKQVNRIQQYPPAQTIFQQIEIAIFNYSKRRYIQFLIANHLRGDYHSYWCTSCTSKPTQTNPPQNNSLRSMLRILRQIILPIVRQLMLQSQFPRPLINHNIILHLYSLLQCRLETLLSSCYFLFGDSEPQCFFQGRWCVCVVERVVVVKVVRGDSSEGELWCDGWEESVYLVAKGGNRSVSNVRNEEHGGDEGCVQVWQAS